MSLPHAILTALLERPSSGLELTRRFDRSIGYFWSATHQQIYRELGKLEQGGLIEAVPQPPSRGQRKEYLVLPAGRSELTRWVGQAQDPKPIRDPLLLRLRAAAVVGTEGLDVELQRHLVEHRRQLDEYLEIEQRDFPAGGGSGGRSGGGDRLHHLVLKGGIALETFWVEWLVEAIADLGGERPERS
ncbi:PadR family transcriptional regulator [Streptacidiphilus carbonis]|uniref:PadR family transcriptional regulator n=1 Tax=Streptacidiphilus carbonis TaxID=105422 RepID=UPI0005A602A9|nr:PadR family transcriptional regulator [Streptacidiphilus carbonis]